DEVALELVLNHLKLPLDHFRHAEHQVLDLDLGFDAISAAVESALTEPGKIKRGLAQRLAGNSAGVETDAPEVEVLVRNGDAFAGLRCLQRGVVPGWSAPDHYQVVVVSRLHVALRHRSATRWLQINISRGYRGLGQCSPFRLRRALTLPAQPPCRGMVD